MELGKWRGRLFNLFLFKDYLLSMRGKVLCIIRLHVQGEKKNQTKTQPKEKRLPVRSTVSKGNDASRGEWERSEHEIMGKERKAIALLTKRYQWLGKAPLLSNYSFSSTLMKMSLYRRDHRSQLLLHFGRIPIFGVHPVHFES